MLQGLRYSTSIVRDEIKRWAEFKQVGTAYFAGVDQNVDIEKLFRATVKIVELEPHNYCNRVCSFCGNSTIDRRSKKIVMPKPIYSSILQTLKHIAYSGQIRFARYSEPLALDSIYAMLSDARSACPNAELMIISNGDYVYPEVLERLTAVGLNRLHVSIYLPAKEKWSVERAKHFSELFLNRINCSDIKHSIRPDSIMGVVKNKKLVITYNSVNYDVHGVYREGSKQTNQKSYERSDPCMLVMQNVTVDFDGTVMPCCNVRSDSSSHSSYMLGKIGMDGDLLSIWGNEKSVAWRDGLFSFKKHQAPCSGCKQLTLTKVGRIPVKLMWRRRK